MAPDEGMVEVLEELAPVSVDEPFVLLVATDVLEALEAEDDLEAVDLVSVADALAAVVEALPVVLAALVVAALEAAEVEAEPVPVETN